MGIEQLMVSLFGEQWGIVLCAVLCSACAVIAMFTPAPTADSSAFYRAFYAIVNRLAMNVGKAKNADEVRSSDEVKEAGAGK